MTEEKVIRAPLSSVQPCDSLCGGLQRVSTDYSVEIRLLMEIPPKERETAFLEKQKPLKAV